MAETRDELQGLDVFVHCVGINDRRPIEDYSAPDVDKIIVANIARVAQAFAAALPAADSKLAAEVRKRLSTRDVPGSRWAFSCFAPCPC